MKTKKISLISILGLLTSFIFSQTCILPSTELYTLDGVKISAGEITNDGKPMVMIFWKTNEKKSNDQLLMINDAYQNFMIDRGVKVVAVCIDCVGKISHIKPFVYGNDLDIEVYIDKNGDFKRSMNVLHTPSTLLFDHEMNINCQYVGYCANVEDMLCKKIEQCLALID
jgi:hypothetical protein